ncbi:MAG: purine-nucleoside phosphorylase [Desulfobacterales bacterium]
MPTRDKALEAAGAVRRRFSTRAETAVVTGTGLGGLLERLERPEAVDFRELPHFPATTVESHSGRLAAGRLAGLPLWLLQGRVHLYEGYRAAEVAFPVRVLQELGVRRLILTNAAGGLRPDLSPGDLFAIVDHINLTGENPLLGPNEEAWGPRFPDMAFAWDRGLVRLARACAREVGVDLKGGVYAGLRGPALETPAEVRWLQRIGAEAVGFSTVQEAIAAVHGGMRLCGISVITNVHDPDRPRRSTMAEILAAARAAEPRLALLLEALARRLRDDGPAD